MSIYLVCSQPDLSLVRAVNADTETDIRLTWALFVPLFYQHVWLSLATSKCWITLLSTEVFLSQFEYIYAW